MKIRFREAGAIRAVLDGEIKRLEVLAAPFGAPDRLDRLHQYLDARTDFMINVGDRRPTLYLHGYSPQSRAIEKPVSLGASEVSRIDERGVWMITPDLSPHPLGLRTWQAAMEGNAGASTGSVNYLVRPTDNRPGHVDVWPIAELSIFDKGPGRVPVSDDAIVVPIRAFFSQVGLDFPTAFEAGEDKDQDEADRPPIRTTGVFTMDAEILKAINDGIAAAFVAQNVAVAAAETERAAMRASILEELKKDPAQRRAVFNVVTDDPTKGQDEGKQETYAYMRALVEDARRVADGGLPLRFTSAKRGLEESEAAELGVLVPDDLYAGISEERGKYSLVRRSGMRTFTTDKLTFTVPVATSMAIIPTVAEEGAYVENAPSTVAKTVTLLKKGSLVTVSEESLEDIPVLQQWLTSEAGKALALAENKVLYDLLASIDGVEIATTKVILDSEVLTGYYALVQEYRENAVWIMNDATIGYLRGMLVATPRAYGEIGFETRMMGDKPGEFFMQHRLFSNANWTSIYTTTQDDLKVIDFVDLGETVAWADRRGLSIFVDPYTVRASAGQVQFLPSARFAGVVLRTTALSGIDGHE